MIPTPPARGHSGTTHTDRLFRGAAVQIGAKTAGRSVGLVIQFGLARFLGDALYGLYGVGWTVFQLLGQVASLGLDHAVVWAGSRHAERDRDAAAAATRRGIVLTFGTSAAVGGMLWVAAPVIASRFFAKPELAPVLAGFGLGLAGVAVLRVAAAGTRITQRMGTSALAEDLVLPFSHLGLLVVLLGLGYGLRGAVTAAILAYAAAAAVAIAGLVRLFPEIRRPRASPPRVSALLAFSVPASLATTLSLLAMMVDRLLVGALRSSSEVGHYVAASQAAILLAVVLSAFNAAFAPMIAELHQTGRLLELETVVRTGTRWALVVTLPAALVLLTYPGAILALLGDGFRGGATALQVLVVAQMVNVATGPVGLLLVMSGRQKLWLGLTATSVATNVALNLMLIPRYGLSGAAGATAVSLGGLFVVALLLVRSELSLWPWDRRLLKPGAAAAVLAAGLALAHRVVPEPGGGGLGVVAISAVAVFFSTLVALGIDDQDREVWSRLRAAGRTDHA